MANNGDQDSQREHRPKRAPISRISFRSSTNSEQNSPENQTAHRQQLDQPGDVDGFLQSSVNRGGITQLKQLHLGQRGASNSIDQGRGQPQVLMQQQPDTSRGKRGRQQQSVPDSHSPEIRQTIPGDQLDNKIARKRQSDKKYRDRIRHEKLQTKADLEKLRIENGQLRIENGQLKAENGQLRQECQEMKSNAVKLEAENRYSFRIPQCFGPPQSYTSGFQDVGPSVQPSNINPFDDWPHNRDNGPSVQPSNINPFDDWPHNRDNGVDEYFTVEEFGIRSHEMRENEDRQLMVHPFSMGEHAPINMPEDGFQNEDMQLMPQLFSMETHASMNMTEDCYTFYPSIPSPMSRIHEMLENEDMQFMSWQFSMEGQASINIPEDGFTSLPYIPSPMPNFDEERSHTGKTIIGWLKIRAVIKWGSVTREAAERRAQIVDLD